MLSLFQNITFSDRLSEIMNKRLISIETHSRIIKRLLLFETTTIKIGFIEAQDSHLVSTFRHKTNKTQNIDAHACFSLVSVAVPESGVSDSTQDLLERLILCLIGAHRDDSHWISQLISQVPGVEFLAVVIITER